MNKLSFYITILLLLFFNTINAQNTEFIELQYDVSGYESSPLNRQTLLSENESVSTDTIPTIKSEMNVSEVGAMTYMVPIEVMDGKNDFQPNIALFYNSQSGNGMAGWGWNISGLSAITMGGKSKFTDGKTIGTQFDGNDPFYLDGERLLTISPTVFETQKFSKIKINRDLSANQTSGFSFTVQYTDGKVAKYREIVPGQHMIVLLKDAFNNEIHYTYTTINNVAYISIISYGGTNVMNDTFRINFTYETRTVSPISYRNGIQYKNVRVLKEIESSSSLLTLNNGRYRRYILSFDKIKGNTVERLKKIELENENGIKLKPLNFYYNSSQTALIQNETTYSNPLPGGTTQLGSVAIGDFYKMGKPVSVYEAKQDWYYTVVGNSGLSYFGTYYRSKELFAGKCLLQGKLNDNDQLLSVSTDYRGYLGSLVNGYPSSALVDRLEFDFRDLVTGQFRSFTLDFPAGATDMPIMFGNNVVHSGQRNETGRDLITGDFNNDGITDMIIFEKSDLVRPQKIYFLEVGKHSSGGSASSLTVLTGVQLVEDSRIFQIEFDGDGVPELMVIGTDNGIYNLYKINLTTNSLIPIQGQQNIQLSNYNKRTPLLFGDYNGDGLTDFVTPQKVYRFEDTNPAREVYKMENDELLWWQYISTGKGISGFVKTQKNYTEQKLAYLAPSYRHVIKRGAFWQNFWAGNADSYDYTEYGACTILPIDIDNDGKTDLASFRKFGKVKYNQNGLLRSTTVDNSNSFVYYDINYGIVIPSTETVNKLFFHHNITDSSGNPQFVNLPTVLSLQNVSISPMSVALSNTDYNQLHTCKSEIYIIDALSQSRRISINNDNFNEGLIRTVDNGTSILQKIEYRPMVEKNANNQERNYSTSSYSPYYPLYVHKNSGVTYLVHKMHTLFDTTILTKEYRFQNAVQDLSGKGFIGFEKIFESDLYYSRFQNSNYTPLNLLSPTFWTIKRYNPLMDNVLVSKTHGSLNQSEPYSSDNQNPNSVFTKSVISSSKFDMGNNRYLILPITESNYDFLNDVTISKTYQYETTSDIRLKQVYTDYNSQASSLEKYFYTPEFNDGEHYYYGKIFKIENTNIRDGVVFTTKSENTYNPNGTLLQTKKFGITSSLASMPSVPSIVTDYTYNASGNIETETLSTTNVATNTGVASLTTTYEYDSTQRYVWKVTSADGLIKITNVNALGRIISEVSELGLTTSYKFDSWGNVKEITDFLGKKTLIKKMLGSIGGSYIISKKREGGAEVRVLMDKFNREIKTSTQTLNNQWVNVSTWYDYRSGKKTIISEPYFDNDVVLQNITEYDYLDRPIKHTSFNGKVVTTCYEKMKVTVDDGFKKTAKWLDATGNTIRFKDSGGEIFYKYYPNGSLRETDYQGIKTKIEIDAWGNKTKLIDPSAGTYLYENDNLGRIKKETNPRGGITQYTYDDWGRPLTENTTGGSGENTTIQKTFSYDGVTHLPTVVNGTYNGKSFTYTTFYNDPFHRITGKKEQTPDFTYETTSTYDDIGRVDVTKLKTILNSPSYTSETNIKNNYDSNSILVSQTDLGNSQVIWTVNTVNSHGKTTQMTYGNDYVLNTTYDAATLSLTKIKHEKDGISAVDIEYNFDTQREVLLSRNNLIFGKNEIFDYDELNRLLEEKVNGIVTQSYTYDNKGRMTSNTDVGKYNYNEQNYKLESLNYNTNGNQLNTDRGFAEVQYNTFKNPNEIFLAGKDRITYEYSILKTRSAAYYGSLNTDATQRPNRKFYSADKAIEIVKENNTTKIITYITGDPYSANYIKIDLLTGNALTSLNHYYLHRDSQSSIVSISKADSSGALVEQRFFDAWGNLKNAIISGVAQTPNTLGWIPSLLIDRGYTGHEHLKTVGLIHMNGRLYDPKLKRFLSPDNFVQDAFNTQNYNRYGYVLNNPLLYTDPSGEVLSFGAVVLIGIGVAVLGNSINNVINGVPFWYGTGKAAVIGGASAAISFGIGGASVGMTFFDKALFQAVMHGMSGGLMSSLSGGEFGSGFASGMVSSVLSSAIGGSVGASSFAIKNPGLFKAIMLASGGLSGGFSSAIAGGKFVDGFRQGIITTGLNHLVHDVFRDISEKKTFRQRFHKIDPDAKPEASLKHILALHDDVDGLGHSYSKSNSPRLIIKDEVKAGVMAEYDPNKHEVNIYKSSFTSNYRLASTLFHEYFHSYQYTFNGGAIVKFFQDKYNIVAYKNMYGIETKSQMALEAQAYSRQIWLGDTDTYIISEYNDRARELNWPIYK